MVHSENPHPCLYGLGILSHGVKNSYHIRPGEVKKIFPNKKIRSFRISSPKPYIPLVEETLLKEGIQVEPASFYPNARICIKEKWPLGSSIANYFGHIYIQDLSSMLPPLVLGPEPGSVVLDLCASPGGKSAILSELVGKDGIIIANEPNKKRLLTLQKNIERLNLLNVITTSYNGQEFPNLFKFKYILADVPCSGWGTVEKNPKVKQLWTGDKIATLIRLQREIIKRAFELLDIGGKLVYSTCTTNIEENQKQIEWALKNFPFELVPLKKFKSFFYEEAGPYTDKVLCVRGHELYSQGFFVACLKKTKQGQIKDIKRDISQDIRPINPEFIEESLYNMGLCSNKFPNGIFYSKKNKVLFLPTFPGWERIKSMGIVIGQIKGRSFSPSQRLWILLKKDGENLIVLNNIETIKKIISGISLNTSSNHKIAKLYYKDLPLCMLTVKGNRCLIGK